LITEDQSRIAIGLRPKNIHQVSISLYDHFRPLSGADIKISNVRITEDMDDEDHDVANGKNYWLEAYFDRKNKLLEIQSSRNKYTSWKLYFFG
jgi:hypothetical protein